MFSKVLILAGSLIASSSAFANSAFDLYNECTTAGTEYEFPATYRRMSCETVQCFRAPGNSLINQDSISVVREGENGSNSGEKFYFEEQMRSFEIPNSGGKFAQAKVTTGVCLVVYAKSPAGVDNVGSRGWTQARLRGTMVLID